MPSLRAKNPASLLSNASALTRLVKDRGVALVHARSRAPAWSALWAARRARRPFVTTYHGVYNARSAPKRFYNSVMARGDVVIANSEFTAVHVRGRYPRAADRVVAIPRGVDLAVFTPEAVSAERMETLARDWGLRRKPGEALILLPARLTAWKGQRVAIGAAARLFVRHPLLSWRLILAGDAQGRETYLADLRSAIIKHGLEDRIAIVGHCSDMPAAFALADIVLAPSTEPEAFGRVAAEAGAMGRPVIGSNLGGQREVIVNGETGRLIPPADPGALADAMAALIGDPAGRAAMGQAAQHRIRTKFTTSALQAATLAVYERLIGQSAIPASANDPA
jgi:glycosyltransferase involved in cell wall biosynthesis